MSYINEVRRSLIQEGRWDMDANRYVIWDFTKQHYAYHWIDSHGIENVRRVSDNINNTIEFIVTTR